MRYAPARVRIRFASLQAALLLSGAAALVYQTAWGRMLQRVFGVGDLAVATVLGSFFLGLGLGSALGGRWGRKATRPARTYALLETGIAVWAVLSLLLIPNLHGLYSGLGPEASFEGLTAVRLALSLAILLPPTLLMGATLPVLIGVVSRARASWGTPATVLYAVNTFGAMLGAGLTGLWLIPTIGTRASILLAALASLGAAAIVAVAFSRTRDEQDEAEAQATTPSEPAPAPPLPSDSEPPGSRLRAPDGPRRHVALAIGLAAIAGFAALASEVLWTRVLRMIVQGTTPAFAAMLVNYLLGIAAGSLIADRIVGGPRSRRSPLRIFAWSQTLLGLLTLLAMAVTPHLPRLMGMIRGDATLEPHRTWVVLVLASILLLPLALVIGTAIPLAWRIATVPRERVPTHAGRVLAANTIGGLLGSLIAGFLLVPAVGVEAAIVLVMLVHLAASAVAFFRQHDVGWRRRLGTMAVPVLIAVAALWAGPSIDLPFLLDARNDPYKAIVEGPEAEWPRELVFLREGRNTTVSVVRTGDGSLRLYNDGRPESGFGGEEPGFGAELALLGGLPTLFAEERERALVIGLGAGHTATMLLGGPWERVDVIELEEAVVAAARVLHEEYGKPFPLDDERAHLVVDDARAQLVLAEPGTWDAIVSQPSHPWLAGSSALYTREFFREARRALSDGGVMALWINLFRADVDALRSVVATLLSVFPHGHGFVVEESSLILVASESKIPLDERVADRARDPGLEPYLSPHRLDHVIDVATVRELDPEALTGFASGAPLLGDDRPTLEYRLAAISADDVVTRDDLDRALRDFPWMGAPAYGELPRDHRVEALVERTWEVSTRPVAIDRLEASLGALPLDRDSRAYVEGAVAEARGRVDRALDRYDASRIPRAAYSADRLRLLERRHAEAIERARARTVEPSIARPLLSHAAALADPEAARFAIRSWETDADPADEDLARAVGAWVDQGCAGLLAQPDLDAVARQDEHVAFLAERCAIERDDPEAAARFAELRHEVRRATAIREAGRGLEALENEGLGAAERYLRRALAANPTHGGAAAALAKVLSRTERREEARELLLRTRRSSEGLPRALEAVEAAAAELGFVLDRE